MIKFKEILNLKRIGFGFYGILTLTVVNLFTFVLAGICIALLFHAMQLNVV